MDELQRSKTSTQLVIEAVEDLHAQEQVATRDTIAAAAGLKLSIVDDRLKVLVNDGRLHRVSAGVFVPAAKHPPSRPISKTVLPDGRVKLEIGDDILTLTPKEDRALAALQAGVAIQFAAIGLGHQAAALASGVNERVLRLERMASAPANEASTHRAKRDRRAVAPAGLPEGLTS